MSWEIASARRAEMESQTGQNLNAKAQAVARAVPAQPNGVSHQITETMVVNEKRKMMQQTNALDQQEKNGSRGKTQERRMAKELIPDH